MNANQARTKLKADGIEFVEEAGFSGFHKITFIFANRKTALKAEKSLGMPTKAHFKKYCFTFY